MLTLDITIITYRPEGIARLAEADLPRMAGVTYVISWQDHRGLPVPEQLVRDDVKVVRCDLPGLSNNRNNALSACTSDIIMIADDDVIFYPEGIRRLIEAFEQHPEVDIATFRARLPHPKFYPTAECRLGLPLPKGYSVSSWETALRRKTAGHMRVCPELGLGAPYFQSGEDEALVLAAIKRGMNCRYFPLTVIAHPDFSTGYDRNMSKGVLRGQGCIIALTHPATAILRIPLKAWRLWRGGNSPFWKSLYYLTQAALKSPALRKRNPDTLW